MLLSQVSSLTGQNNLFDLPKKVILIYSEEQFMLLLGVSELQIHPEPKRNSIFHWYVDI